MSEDNKVWLLLGVILGCVSLLPVMHSYTVMDARIYGGSPISISDAPYQVSVRLKYLEAQKFGYGHICGGSVISSRVVLTAAHCIADTSVSPMTYRTANQFTIVMGDTYLEYLSDYTLQFNVQQVVHNVNFNIDTLIWDVALMFINGKVPSNYPTVSSIALNTVPIAGGTLCLVSGWGKINANQISNTLMQAVVPIVTNAICSLNYGNIPTSMICAGNMTAGGVDACQGDSGGPLVCNGVLAGIVSWGDGCAKPGYPGVYTNVSYYRGWIESTNATFNYSYYAGASGVLRSSLAVVTMSAIVMLLLSLK